MDSFIRPEYWKNYVNSLTELNDVTYPLSSKVSRL
jgi:hypothetical protein